MTTGDGTNFIAFACGMRRSGKSHLLAQMALRFPRRLVLDFIGEFDGKIKGAYECETLRQTQEALIAARDSGARWTVHTGISPNQVPELIKSIASKRNGFAKAVGGIVLECGEADLIAPNNAGISEEIFNIFARGRHIGLSALMATQRPRAVHRIVTSQSDMIAAFRQHELLDVDYLSDLMGTDAAKRIANLQLRQHVRYFPNFQLLETVDVDGTVIKTQAA